MSLGSDLTFGIYTALRPSDTPATFKDNLALAITEYLSTAEYGSGAILYTSSLTGSAFAMPAPATATAATAAQAVGNGVMSYWGATGVATGTEGIPTVEATVVAGSGVITASTVGPAITSGLTTVFSDLSSGQYWVNAEVTDHLTISGEELATYDNNPSLLVFNTVDVSWLNRQGGAWVTVTDTKWHQIASVISSAVEAIVVSWSEVTAPNSPVPYIGGIE